jgi:hypothetical protein
MKHTIKKKLKINKQQIHSTGKYLEISFLL